MVDKPNRRSFLKGAGAAVAGLTLPTATVSAKSREDRFIIDLQNVSEGALDGLTVVHDLSQIDIAVVEGEKDAVEGLRHSKDVEMEFQVDREHRDDDDDDHDWGGDNHHHKDWTIPSRYEYQWDKQAQDLLGVYQKTTGEGTRVSVIDSGAMRGHPDLTNALNTDLSKNFTGDGGDFTPWYNDHGTHVSGIIAADGSNEKGILGSAPNTDLVELRVFTGPFAFFGDIIAAMTYSGDIESDVANMSLGVYPLPNDADTATLRDSIERATDYAAEKGTLMVAAAGNDGVNLDTDGDVISLPNEADNVMSVSATGPIGYRWDDEKSNDDNSDEDSDDEDGWHEYGDDDGHRGRGDEDGWHGHGDRDGYDRYRFPFDDPIYDLQKPTTTPATYTNYGEEAVDVSAAGGNIPQDAPEDAKTQYDMVLSTIFEWADDGSMKPSYGWKAGTSMAAPQVTAAAALVKSVNPDASPKQIREHLEATADDLHQPSYSGEGHLDLAAAVFWPIWGGDHDWGDDDDDGHGHHDDDERDDDHGWDGGHDDEKHGDED
ncbi:S8 family serine peptidase [Halorussus halophilus]|uniref:S8 family serine peptidase n=1 Tax=Halorussus halophilus TaxID=2650975 RepID=UPI0013012369|nr:S8 family serine peptidase [Halorussus halophilus]